MDSLFYALKQFVLGEGGDEIGFDIIVLARTREFRKSIGRKQINALITIGLVRGKMPLPILQRLMMRTKTRIGKWPILAALSNRNDLVTYLVYNGCETKFHGSHVYHHIFDNKARTQIRELREQQYSNFLSRPMERNFIGYNWKLVV